MTRGFFSAVAIAFTLLAASPGRALDPSAFAAEHPDTSYLSADEILMVEASGLTLDDFLWIARPLVIFADSPQDPRFKRQMEYIADDWADLADRDVAVIIDTDPAAKSAIRETLRPRGFDLVLIGKDGAKYLRKPIPYRVREIARSIDKMPLRQQELRESRGQD